MKPSINDDKKGRAASTRDRILFVLVVLSLVFTCVGRLFPASEMARPTQSALMIVIELALGVGLVGLGIRILKGIPRGVAGRGIWIFLFGAGLVCFLAIFGIHLIGGQRVKSPQSRSVLVDPSMKALAAEIEIMNVRLNELKALVEKAAADLDNTRWERTGQATPNQLRNLGLEDLREYRSKQRALLDSIDRVLQYATESDFDGKSERLFRQAESQGLTLDRKRPDLRSWRVLRRERGASYELTRIVEEHWEEWRSLESFPPEADLNPWQKEMKRLTSEETSAANQLHQLSDPSSKATSPKETKDK